MTNITLHELFNKKTVDELKKTAAAFKVKDCRKMRKAELVNVCAMLAQREGFFEEVLFIMSPKTWKLYEKTAKSDNGLKSKDKPIEYDFLEITGFLYEEKCEEGYWFIIPDEIKKRFDELMKTSFDEAKEFSDLVHQYAQAAVNLYGVISQEELVEIFNSQNELQTDISINFNVYMKHQIIDADYCLWEEYVVHNDLEEDDFEGAKVLIADANGKPRYIPPKSEFLRYADWQYYENTKQLVDMSKFLLNKCDVSNDIINKLMFELQWEFAQDSSVQNYFDVLEKYNVIIHEKHIDELIKLIMNCCNNTRLWVNKGHTPNELVKYYRPPKAKSQKIGRNELCPCGSGKKYKKCCGR